MTLRILALLVSCAACATSPDLPEAAADAVRRTESRAGTYTVSWRPVGRTDVPLNEPFELDVVVQRNLPGGGREPVPDAKVIVSGWMPDHGHGMIRMPRAESEGDGAYRVKGMLLHMGGEWQLFVDLIVDDVSERAEFALEL